MIHCIVWAKALFEGLFGPKEAATQNIIEDIIEDLEKARTESKSNEASGSIEFIKILFDKVFGDEPKNLVATLSQWTENPDCDEEERKSNREFINKIKPLFFKDFSQTLETVPNSDNQKDLDQKTQTKVQSLES